MKNLFAVLLASLMLFSFAACSSDTDNSSDTNQSNVETVTTDEESGSDSTEETTDETDSEADATDETGSDAADATGTTDETASDSAEETAGTAEQQTITGTIDGTDTSGATVVKLVQTSAQ